MRNLNIVELEEKIFKYALDIQYIDRQHLDNSLYQFLNFLESQPISKRIMQRIDEDYHWIIDSIPSKDAPDWNKQRKSLKEKLKTPEDQGAFGYIIIINMFRMPKNPVNNSFIQLAASWFDSRGDYDKWRNDFNELIFKPFIELINWYITESHSTNSSDYFSKAEIVTINDQLTDLHEKIRNLGFGQEIIFNEIEELNELLKFMNKKNWNEIFKGKFIDLVISNVINMDTMKMAYQFIGKSDLKSLIS